MRTPNAYRYVLATGAALLVMACELKEMTPETAPTETAAPVPPAPPAIIPEQSPVATLPQKNTPETLRSDTRFSAEKSGCIANKFIDDPDSQNPNDIIMIRHGEQNSATKLNLKALPEDKDVEEALRPLLADLRKVRTTGNIPAQLEEISIFCTQKSGPNPM
jgi:hypothetical protein